MSSEALVVAASEKLCAVVGGVLKYVLIVISCAPWQYVREPEMPDR